MGASSGCQPSSGAATWCCSTSCSSRFRRTYDELEVNDRLRVWCDGGEVDHVTIRRYLIDMKLLHRADGLYWVDLSSPPEPNIAERTVTALGLD